MKTRWIVALAVVVVIVILSIRPRQHSVENVAVTATPVPRSAMPFPEPIAATQPANPTSIADAPTSPAEPSAPTAPADAPPRTGVPTVVEVRGEIENVQFAVRDYRTAMGENPVGNNAEITKALVGDNLKQVKIPIPTGSSVNANGELCDRWGTPYFFHQLSAKQMEVRSAGPDREMWTADDVNAK